MYGPAANQASQAVAARQPNHTFRFRFKKKRCFLVCHQRLRITNGTRIVCELSCQKPGKNTKTAEPASRKSKEVWLFSVRGAGHVNFFLLRPAAGGRNVCRGIESIAGDRTPFLCSKPDESRQKPGAPPAITSEMSHWDRKKRPPKRKTRGCLWYRFSPFFLYTCVLILPRNRCTIFLLTLTCYIQ